MPITPTPKALLHLLACMAFCCLLAMPAGAQVNVKLEAPEIEQLREEFQRLYNNGNYDALIDRFEETLLLPAKEPWGQKKPPKLRKEINLVPLTTQADIYDPVLRAYIALGLVPQAKHIIRQWFALNPSAAYERDWNTIANAFTNDFFVAPRLSLGINFAPVNSSWAARPGNGDERSVIEGLVNGEDATHSSSYVSPSDLFSPPLHPLFPKNENLLASNADTWVEKAYDHFTERGVWNNYTNSRSFQLGLHGKYGISHNLDLIGGIYLNSFRYRTVNRYQWVHVFPNDFQLKILHHFEHQNTLTYIELPHFGLRYTHRSKKGLSPYVQAGYSLSWRIGGEKLIHFEEELFVGPSEIPVPGTEKDIGLQDLMRPLTHSLNLEAGLDVLNFQVRQFPMSLKVYAAYQHGLSIVFYKDERRQTNSQLVYANYFIYDDIRLRQLNLGCHIELPLSYYSFRRSPLKRKPSL